MMNWISTKDELPKNFENVLVTTDFHHGKRDVEIAYYNGNENYWFLDLQPVETDIVVAWMPLPEPVY